MGGTGLEPVTPSLSSTFSGGDAPLASALFAAQVAFPARHLAWLCGGCSDRLCVYCASPDGNSWRLIRQGWSAWLFTRQSSLRSHGASLLLLGEKRWPTPTSRSHDASRSSPSTPGGSRPAPASTEDRCRRRRQPPPAARSTPVDRARRGGRGRRYSSPARAAARSRRTRWPAVVTSPLGGPVSTTSTG
jgi:hypothetical protein